MKKSLLGILAVGTLALTGCAKKCSFEEFCKKVSEIEVGAEEKIEEYSIKGKITIGGKEVEINREIKEEKDVEGLSLPEATAMAILAANHVSVYTVAEDKEATYYAGSTFKVELKAITFEFDKYGMCTRAKGEAKESLITYTVDLKASYSYK